MVKVPPIRLSAMNFIHARCGGVLVERDGWHQPIRYDSLENELTNLRSSVGICDVSPTGKFLIQGNDIDSYLSKTSFGFDMAVAGQVIQHKDSKRPEVDTFRFCRLTENEMLLLTNPQQTTHLSEYIEDSMDQCAHIVDISSGLAGIKIIGPKAKLLLSSVTNFDLEEKHFGDMSCVQISLLGIHHFLIRMDVADVFSYELYFAREYGQYIWESLERSGKPFCVAPIGIDSVEYLEKQSKN